MNGGLWKEQALDSLRVTVAEILTIAMDFDNRIVWLLATVVLKTIKHQAYSTQFPSSQIFHKPESDIVKSASKYGRLRTRRSCGGGLRESRASVGA